MYKIILEHEYLPTHAVEVFKNWQKEKTSFKVFKCHTEEVRKGAFYISSKEEIVDLVLQ